MAKEPNAQADRAPPQPALAKEDVEKRAAPQPRPEESEKEAAASEPAAEKEAAEAVDANEDFFDEEMLAELRRQKKKKHPKDMNLKELRTLIAELENPGTDIDKNSSDMKNRLLAARTFERKKAAEEKREKEEMEKKRVEYEKKRAEEEKKKKEEEEKEKRANLRAKMHLSEFRPLTFAKRPVRFHTELLQNWEIRHSKTQKKDYWFHSLTKQSSWEHPCAPPECFDVDGTGARFQERRSKDGRFYFHDPVTGESKWAPPLVEGWKVNFHKDFENRLVYQHQESQLQTWERPVFEPSKKFSIETGIVSMYKKFPDAPWHKLISFLKCQRVTNFAHRNRRSHDCVSMCLAMDLPEIAGIILERLAWNSNISRAPKNENSSSSSTALAAVSNKPVTQQQTQQILKDGNKDPEDINDEIENQEVLVARKVLNSKPSCFYVALYRCMAAQSRNKNETAVCFESVALKIFHHPLYSDQSDHSTLQVALRARVSLVNLVKPIFEKVQKAHLREIGTHQSGYFPVSSTAWQTGGMFTYLTLLMSGFRYGVEIEKRATRAMHFLDDWHLDSAVARTDDFSEYAELAFAEPEDGDLVLAPEHDGETVSRLMTRHEYLLREEARERLESLVPSEPSGGSQFEDDENSAFMRDDDDELLKLTKRKKLKKARKKAFSDSEESEEDDSKKSGRPKIPVTKLENRPSTGSSALNNGKMKSNSFQLSCVAKAQRTGTIDNIEHAVEGPKTEKDAALWRDYSREYFSMKQVYRECQCYRFLVREFLKRAGETINLQSSHRGESPFWLALKQKREDLLFAIYNHRSFLFNKSVLWTEGLLPRLNANLNADEGYSESENEQKEKSRYFNTATRKLLEDLNSRDFIEMQAFFECVQSRYLYVLHRTVEQKWVLAPKLLNDIMQTLLTEGFINIACVAHAEKLIKHASWLHEQKMDSAAKLFCGPFWFLFKRDGLQQRQSGVPSSVHNVEEDPAKRPQGRGKFKFWNPAVVDENFSLDLLERIFDALLRNLRIHFIERYQGYSNRVKNDPLKRNFWTEILSKAVVNATGQAKNFSNAETAARAAEVVSTAAAAILRETLGGAAAAIRPESTTPPPDDGFESSTPPPVRGDSGLSDAAAAHEDVTPSVSPATEATGVGNTTRRQRNQRNLRFDDLRHPVHLLRDLLEAGGKFNDRGFLKEYTYDYPVVKVDDEMTEDTLGISRRAAVTGTGEPISGKESRNSEQLEQEAAAAARVVRALGVSDNGGRVQESGGPAAEAQKAPILALEGPRLDAHSQTTPTDLSLDFIRQRFFGSWKKPVKPLQRFLQEGVVQSCVNAISFYHPFVGCGLFNILLGRLWRHTKCFQHPDPLVASQDEGGPPIDGGSSFPSFEKQVAAQSSSSESINVVPNSSPSASPYPEELFPGAQEQEAGHEKTLDRLKNLTLRALHFSRADVLDKVCVVPADFLEYYRWLHLHTSQVCTVNRNLGSDDTSKDQKMPGEQTPEKESWAELIAGPIQAAMKRAATTSSGSLSRSPWDHAEPASSDLVGSLSFPGDGSEDTFTKGPTKGNSKLKVRPILFVLLLWKASVLESMLGPIDDSANTNGPEGWARPQLGPAVATHRAYRAFLEHIFWHLFDIEQLTLNVIKGRDSLLVFAIKMLIRFRNCDKAVAENLNLLKTAAVRKRANQHCSSNTATAMKIEKPTASPLPCGTSVSSKAESCSTRAETADHLHSSTEETTSHARQQMPGTTADIQKAEEERVKLLEFGASAESRAARDRFLTSVVRRCAKLSKNRFAFSPHVEAVPFLSMTLPSTSSDTSSYRCMQVDTVNNSASAVPPTPTTTIRTAFHYACSAVRECVGDEICLELLKSPSFCPKEEQEQPKLQVWIDFALEARLPDIDCVEAKEFVDSADSPVCSKKKRKDIEKAETSPGKEASQENKNSKVYLWKHRHLWMNSPEENPLRKAAASSDSFLQSARSQYPVPPNADQRLAKRILHLPNVFGETFLYQRGTGDTISAGGVELPVSGEWVEFKAHPLLVAAYYGRLEVVNAYVQTANLIHEADEFLSNHELRVLRYLCFGWYYHRCGVAERDDKLPALVVAHARRVSEVRAEHEKIRKQELDAVRREEEREQERVQQVEEQLRKKQEAAEKEARRVAEEQQREAEREQREAADLLKMEAKLELRKQQKRAEKKKKTKKLAEKTEEDVLEDYSKQRRRDCSTRLHDSLEPRSDSEGAQLRRRSRGRRREKRIEEKRGTKSRKEAPKRRDSSREQQRKNKSSDESPAKKRSKRENKSLENAKKKKKKSRRQEEMSESASEVSLASVLSSPVGTPQYSPGDVSDDPEDDICLGYSPAQSVSLPSSPDGRGAHRGDADCRNEVVLLRKDDTKVSPIESDKEVFLSSKMAAPRDQSSDELSSREAGSRRRRSKNRKLREKKKKTSRKEKLHAREDQSQERRSSKNRRKKRRRRGSSGREARSASPFLRYPSASAENSRAKAETSTGMEVPEKGTTAGKFQPQEPAEPPRGRPASRFDDLPVMPSESREERSGRARRKEGDGQESKKGNVMQERAGSQGREPQKSERDIAQSEKPAEEDRAVKKGNEEGCASRGPPDEERHSAQTQQVSPKGPSPESREGRIASKFDDSDDDEPLPKPKKTYKIITKKDKEAMSGPDARSLVAPLDDEDEGAAVAASPRKTGRRKPPATKNDSSPAVFLVSVGRGRPSDQAPKDEKSPRKTANVGGMAASADLGPPASATSPASVAKPSPGPSTVAGAKGSFHKELRGQGKYTDAKLKERFASLSSDSGSDKEKTKQRKARSTDEAKTLKPERTPRNKAIVLEPARTSHPIVLRTRAESQLLRDRESEGQINSHSAESQQHGNAKTPPPVVLRSREDVEQTEGGELEPVRFSVADFEVPSSADGTKAALPALPLLQPDSCRKKESAVSSKRTGFDEYSESDAQTPRSDAARRQVPNAAESPAADTPHSRFFVHTPGAEATPYFGDFKEGDLKKREEPVPPKGEVSRKVSKSSNGNSVDPKVDSGNSSVQKANLASPRKQRDSLAVNPPASPPEPAIADSKIPCNGPSRASPEPEGSARSTPREPRSVALEGPRKEGSEQKEKSPTVAQNLDAASLLSSSPNLDAASMLSSSEQESVEKSESEKSESRMDPGSPGRSAGDGNLVLVSSINSSPAGDGNSVLVSSINSSPVLKSGDAEPRTAAEWRKEARQKRAKKHHKRSRSRNNRRKSAEDPKQPEKRNDVEPNQNAKEIRTKRKNSLDIHSSPEKVHKKKRYTQEDQEEEDGSRPRGLDVVGELESSQDEAEVRRGNRRAKETKKRDPHEKRKNRKEKRNSSIATAEQMREERKLKRRQKGANHGGNSVEVSPLVSSAGGSSNKKSGLFVDSSNKKSGWVDAVEQWDELQLENESHGFVDDDSRFVDDENDYNDDDDEHSFIDGREEESGLRGRDPAKKKKHKRALSRRAGSQDAGVEKKRHKKTRLDPVSDDDDDGAPKSAHPKKLRRNHSARTDSPSVERNSLKKDKKDRKEARKEPSKKFLVSARDTADRKRGGNRRASVLSSDADLPAEDDLVLASKELSRKASEASLGQHSRKRDHSAKYNKSGGSKDKRESQVVEAKTRKEKKRPKSSERVDSSPERRKAVLKKKKSRASDDFSLDPSVDRRLEAATKLVLKKKRRERSSYVQEDANSEEDMDDFEEPKNLSSRKKKRSHKEQAFSDVDEFSDERNRQESFAKEKKKRSHGELQKVSSAEKKKKKAKKTSAR